MNVTMTMEEFKEAKRKASEEIGRAVSEDLTNLFVDTLLKAASAFLPKGKNISINDNVNTSVNTDGFGSEVGGSSEPDFSDMGSCSREFNKTLN